MPTLNELVTFEYGIAYDSAYTLTKKALFTTPKIYSGKGDLSKRWYVYFYYRNKETGRLKLVTPIYGMANKYKTKEERMSVLVMYRLTLLKLLKQGYNPFDDNIELHQKSSSKVKTAPPPSSIVIDEKEETSMQLQEAFNFGLQLKEKVVSERTIRDYKYKSDNFLKWIKEKRPEIKQIHQLNKKLITEFLNAVLAKTSARNRNNYRTELSSVLQVLEDNEIIKENFIKKIPVLKSIPQKNKTFTQKEQENIFEYLEERDPILLLYIKFISYSFIRPIEVCRLKIKDINLVDRTIQFKAKNGLIKTKMIPQILLDDFPDFSALKKESVLFTPNELGAKWETAVDNRRGYFSNQFKKVVKDEFELGVNYGLYSFRHTYITKLYRAFRETLSPFEAKSKLMLITGHTTMIALEKYLRDIDAELPEDYSEMLKN